MSWNVEFAGVASKLELSCTLVNAPAQYDMFTKIASNFGFKELERRIANFVTIHSNSRLFTLQTPPLDFQHRYSFLVFFEYLENTFFSFSDWFVTLYNCL